MKARISSGLAALLAVCLCAQFVPAFFQRCHNHDKQVSASRKSITLKLRRDIALSDLRTAASALRYLLEPEPDQPFQLTVASNSLSRRMGVTNPAPLTLASNAAVQNLARSNVSASPWILGSNVARPRILGPVLSDPQAEPQPAPTRPTCCSRSVLAG
jgi:hypothetical protein